MIKAIGGIAQNIKSLSNPKDGEKDIDEEEVLQKNIFPIAFEKKPVSNRLPAIFSQSVNAEKDLQKRHSRMVFIRDKWIHEKIKERESEFTEYHPIQVFAGTWNVNGKKSEEDLRPWLVDGYLDKDGSLPEIYAIGLQEMVDLNAKNALIDKESVQRRKWWQERLRILLDSCSKRKYTLVESKHLMGVLLCVFVHSQQLPNIKGLQAERGAVGVMGVVGNKGAVAIRFNYFDSSMCFVCSHLAAGRGSVQSRNADFHNLMNKIRFKLDSPHSTKLQSHEVSTFSNTQIEDVDESGNPKSNGNNGSDSDSFGVQHHDFVMWLGDLNYRISDELSIEEVLEKSPENYAELRSMDQLLQERVAGRVFSGFHEAVLDFPPTYKYQIGTSVYEQRPDRKKRAPAWCDRVLYKSTGNSRLNCKSYSCSMTQMKSDHKPVMAVFEADVKTVVRSRERNVFEDITRQFDQYENACLPKASLDRHSLDFGEIRFRERKVESVTLSNDGSTNVHFCFVAKLEDPEFCRPWISATPTCGVILPGQSISIDIEVYVDSSCASMMNTGISAVDDILVIRLLDGRDYFLTVTGKFLRSSFGASLLDLCHIQGPVRNAKFPSEPSSRLLPLPKELWTLVDYIFRQGIATPELFNHGGIPDEMARIREALDQYSSLPNDISIHSVAEVLLDFLRSLASSVIPPQMVPSYEMESVEANKWLDGFQSELPPSNYNAFVYIVSFLKEVLQYSRTNKTTPEMLTSLFARCLCRVPIPSVSQVTPSVQFEPTIVSIPALEKLLMHLLCPISAINLEMQATEITEE
eukprot:TRINITY_DN6014_c1_g1_i1.p1 TRINITY_DN6014_c1_g1~~TRINITY_DN6014_c1_g1_i1.p1  ORF type:complete len:804 (-),score=195.46 TRINITY_DN6014_c1_g1_i1:140-2551(-)